MDTYGADVNIVVMIKTHVTQFMIGTHFDIFIACPSVCSEVSLVLGLR